MEYVQNIVVIKEAIRPHGPRYWLLNQNHKITRSVYLTLISDCLTVMASVSALFFYRHYIYQLM